ncbi:unconventional myosin-IXAa-like isoform X4 [Mya arenaria]|uniref:unconventional myosin-IXAa-like isoform X4 n=1 Tax=Mya arenaria TaxID=6604 RepID=UPI0022E8491C|nr:unconventional myosin-IXAa-like isoform X4 [Mya arenaria]
MALSPIVPPVVVAISAAPGRRMSTETYMVRIYTGPLSQELDFISVEAEKITPAEEVVRVAARKMHLLEPKDYEIAEVFSTAGQLCKERRLGDLENPVRIQLLWPKIVNAEYDPLADQGFTGYRFYIRKKNPEISKRTSSWMEFTEPNPVDNFLTAFLKQPTSNKEYSDLCNLPDLNERTLLENIKSRFLNSNIYTYVGSILIAVNPFKFFPIYNPKYVKMYQNKRLGDLPPHIFAIADAAFYTMLRTKRNQCIVISGESGSGKTESTNLLLHHLTALSHKGLHGSGVEQTILGAGPVLEAFGNAKTVHNNNSSRFGKFIQVNYKENGMVHGAIVEKYLLEKSRIVSQASNERNYHVFYYLLEGAEDLEREKLHLGKPTDYFYLQQSDRDSVEEEDEANEFSRLKQSMEIVGFSQLTQKRIFGVLSAVLHLGNVTFKKKGDQHHDESVTITNPETIDVVSRLLMVKKKTLEEALTQKKTIAGDETVVMTHRMEHAVATRDAMAKCLYGALFDWIVLKVNQALLAKRHNSEHQEEEERTNFNRHTGNSIGVLDIFGFEDFRWNSFEQFCINYANEHLQYYFNQHIFKFEQEEYKKEGIQWMNIEFIDNTGCLELFSKKGKGLFSLLDEECNFPGATNDTLLSKFHHHHARGNVYYEAPQKREMAFTVVHYAGRVKYQVKDFREKNSDQIRTDIVANLKSSSLAFVRELMGVDPVAVLRWTIIKTLIKSVFAFKKAGIVFRKRGGPDEAMKQRRKHPPTDGLNIPTLDSSHFLSPSHSPTHPKRTAPRSSPLHDNHSHHEPQEFTFSDDDDMYLSPKRNSTGALRSPVEQYLSADEARVMRRATRVLMKNKSFKPKTRPQTMFSDIKTLKAIANRTIYIGGKVNSKQKPPSVGAQFQWSLRRLMSALNQANPFFIRCIKSNAEKLPCRFDEVLVLRQLRYTGMLATVRIRQSGYNYRLTFEEFAQLYKIILPKGEQSTMTDIAEFLHSKEMNMDNYQIGKTKVFLREAEKMYIDECLHCAIMKRVITLQRWVKTKVERKNFLQLRENTVIIQKNVRQFLARRREAVLCIQRVYRGWCVRREFRKKRNIAIRIQAHFKGNLGRKRYRAMEEESRRERAEQEAGRHTEDMHSSTSDEGVLIKDNSADELEQPGLIHRSYSEESSGIHDDSESDTLSEVKSRGESIGTPPHTPTSLGTPDIRVEPSPRVKEEFLGQAGQGSRVSKLAEKFQSPDKAGTDDVTDGRSPGVIFVRRGSAARKRPPNMSPAPLAKQESFSDLVDGKLYADSPTSLGSSLSPEQIQHIEDSLRKPLDRPQDSLKVASADDVYRSPLKHIRDKAKHLVVPPYPWSVPQESLRECKSFPSASNLSYTDSLKRKSSFSSTLLRRTKSSIKLLRDMKTGSGGRKKKDSLAEDSDDEMDPQRTSPVSKHSLHSMGGINVLPHLHHHPLSPKSPQQETSPGFPEDEKGKAIEKKRRTRKEKGEKDKENSRPPDLHIRGKTKWQYPEEFVIKETWELQALDKFINEKISQLCKETGRESQFDVVFKKCLKSFHTDLKSHLAVFLQEENKPCNMKYRDLFVNFENTMEATCAEEQVTIDFPVTLCINAFRGYLDEFRKSANTRKKEAKHKKKQKREKAKKDKDVIDHQGHRFLQGQFGIPTFCEMCSNIIWSLEKGYVCQVCKSTCHKKCMYKLLSICRGSDISDQRIVGTKVFGVPLHRMVGPDDKTPVFMDRIIVLIETHGIYTEGIYRKSGSAAKIKALKMLLDSGFVDIDMDTYPVHVLTSVLKTFFRELPEPILTFDLYDEFMQASEIKDEREAIQVMFSLVERIPKVNHDVLERLIFHLARVVLHERNNKMSVNGLAIIFAPCLLRTNRNVQAQEMLTQVSRQQVCIEKILSEQVRKLKTTLQDINTLESAEQTATERLSVVRASIRGEKTAVRHHTEVRSPASVSEDAEILEEQERVISSHIQSIQKEKEDLTTALPTFEYRHSSDDEMLSADDVESLVEDVDYRPDEPTFDTPAKTVSHLSHLTKHRVDTPARHPPSHHLPKQSSEESQDDLKLSDLKDIPSTGGHDLDFDSVDHSGCRRLKIVHETSRPLSDIEFNRAKKYLYTGEDSGSDDRDSEFSNFKRDFSYDILDDRRKRRQVDALLDPFGLPKHSEYSTRRYSDHYRKLNIKSLHLGGVAKKLDTEKIHQPATPMAIISADSVQLKKSKDIMLSPKTRLKLTKPLQLPEQNKESRYQKYISGAEKKKRLNKLDSDLEIDRVLMLKTLGSRSFDDESAISGSFEREQSTGSALSRSSQQFSMSHTFKTLEATSRSHSNTSRSLLDTGSDSDDEIMV